MFAVGRLGSYISRGVYTVSGPFQPFGGAVDIIVVEQPDGSLKSSPWYVRFGKYQGVLKADERVIRINVNEVDADFHMHLDNKGDTFFLREVDAAEGESEMYLSSGDEAELKSDLCETPKSKSFNFEASNADLVCKLESSERKIVPRTNSPRRSYFGLAIGRRSMKENGFREEEGAVGVESFNSLERAEIAADLLEVRWTTNLTTAKNGTDNSPEVSSMLPDVGMDASGVKLEEGSSVRDSSFKGRDKNEVDSSVSDIGNVAYKTPSRQQSVCSEETDLGASCTNASGSYTETYSLQETYIGVDMPWDRSEVSSRADNDTTSNDSYAQSNFFVASESTLKVLCTLDAAQNEGCVSLIEEHSSAGNVSCGGNVKEIGSRIEIDKVESSLCSDTVSQSATCNGQSNDSLLTAGESHKEPKDQISDKCRESELCVPASGMDKMGGSSQDDICNGDEKSLCNVTEFQLAVDIGTSPVCKTEEDVAEDFDKNREVIGDVSTNTNSTIVETSICVSGSDNGLRSGDHYSYTSDLNSIPLVSDKQSSNVDMGRQPLSLGATECSGDSSHGRIAYVTLPGNSEEQFSFSDLDDTKVVKVERIDASSPDDEKECLHQDSPESSEEELSEAITSDDELHQTTVKPFKDDLLVNCPTPEVKPNSASSPITISKVHKDADLEFLAPVVESLPNMPFVGDNINPYGTPELLSRSLDSNFEALKIVNNDVQAFSESGAEQQITHARLETNSSSVSEEIRKIVSDPAVEISLCRHLLYEGMGYEAASVAFEAENLETDNFFSLCPDILKDDKLVVRIGGLYFPWDAALPIASTIGSQGNDQILEPKGMIAVGLVDKPSEEGPPKSMNSKNGSWKLWPFSFRRSNSRKDSDLDSETIPKSPIKNDERQDAIRTKVMKKRIRAKVPTSEQLVSLNLKEGMNVVTFTFSTAKLGNQQVDARIFLWKWNTRIVISDVDGTITKSDVLGQFMPLMGLDWSHTGVAHLFSAIKENGYHLLFLSARSILQAYHTRQFLVNLKQDGKPLPEGPIVISPDGLFPSLYREVIRRAPHEFKISCLEDIKALFPKDHNPFYAGFGNRHTDELSYLRVGIPKGKIFTINPKSQVVVNRRVDTRSYTSLHALVHDMFPPTTVKTVTEQEDYNSWNFWRLPPPDVRI